MLPSVAFCVRSVESLPANSILNTSPTINRLNSLRERRTGNGNCKVLTSTPEIPLLIMRRFGGPFPTDSLLCWGRARYHRGVVVRGAGGHGNAAISVAPAGRARAPRCSYFTWLCMCLASYRPAKSALIPCRAPLRSTTTTTRIAAYCLRCW